MWQGPLPPVASWSVAAESLAFQGSRQSGLPQLETSLAACCAKEWLAFPAAQSGETCFPLWKVSGTILSLSWDNYGKVSLRNVAFHYKYS